MKDRKKNAARKMRFLNSHRGVIMQALAEKHAERAEKMIEEIARYLASKYGEAPTGAVALAMSYLADILVVDIMEFPNDRTLYPIN